MIIKNLNPGKEDSREKFFYGLYEWTFTNNEHWNEDEKWIL